MVPVSAVEPTRPIRVVEPTQRPSLGVVPVTRRRRWPALLAGFTALLLLAAMLGAAIFHTQLAERQLEIDALGVRVQDERERFDLLRLRHAQLRSPARLAEEADRLGMTRSTQSRYLEVDRWAFAIQIAAAGPASDGVSQFIVQGDQLDQYREIKSVTAGNP